LAGLLNQTAQEHHLATNCNKAFQTAHGPPMQAQTVIYRLYGTRDMLANFHARLGRQRTHEALYDSPCRRQRKIETARSWYRPGNNTNTADFTPDNKGTNHVRTASHFMSPYRENE
jgi:hypothetical protein